MSQNAATPSQETHREVADAYQNGAEIFSGGTLNWGNRSWDVLQHRAPPFLRWLRKARPGLGSNLVHRQRAQTNTD
jgi:hypothetical protein